MKVTAALCWWNETVEDLRTAVTSAASVADRVVALDGAYARYPGATVRSGDEQADAIRDAAESAGIEALVVRPDRLWVGQCEKRTALMNLAADGSDWIVILDADYVIDADREHVRDQLAATEYDVLRVPLVTPPGEYATNWHREQAEAGEQWTPLVYRAYPEWLVEERHWWYSAIKDGRRVWMWDGDDRYGRVPHGQLLGYRVEHRSALQSHESILAARAWYNDCDLVTGLTGQEDDIDGLPAPSWDYERIPF